MTKPAETAALVDRFLQVLDDWIEPVTIKQICNADRSVTRYQVASALKFLTSEGLVYSEEVRRGIVYLPAKRRPVCPIQDLLCLGPKRFSERATHG